MLRSSVVVLAVLALTVMRCGPPESKKGTNGPAGQPPGGQRGASAADMMRDPFLWGPDYPVAMRSIPAFARAGETKVEILPRRMVGTRKYPDSGAAERDAGAAAQTQASPPPMRVPVGAPAAQQRPLPPVSAVVFPDDRSIRLGTPDQDVRYIAMNARIEQVQQRWGKPERITEEVRDDGTERRPIALTLYHYANDAVIVVTTDINDPHAVDRVILDTKAVMQAIF